MKKCNSCGKEFAEGTFCPECGEKLEDIIQNVDENANCFCPNCGTKMSNGAAFCPNCGWSKNGTKAANVKSGLKMPNINNKLLFAIPIAIVVIAVLFFAKNLLFGGGGLGKGGDAILNGVNNSASALLKNEIVDIAYNTLANGSIEMKMSEMPDGVPVSGNVNAKVYFGNNKYAFTFDGEINDTAFKNNIIYLDNDKAVAKIPVAFGDNKIYGANIDNLSDSWVMDNLSSSDRSRMQKALDNRKQLEKIDRKAFTKDISKLYLDGYKVLKSTIKKNLKFENENETCTIGSKNVKALKVSTKINSEQAAKISKDVLNWAKDNKDIKPFLKKYYILFEVASNTSYDYDTVYENFIAEIDKMLENIESNSDTNKLDLRLQFYMAKDTKQLVEVRVVDENSNNEYTFICGPDWKNPEKISISDGKYTNFVYTMTNDGSDYTYKLTQNDNEIGRVNWNKKSGEFNIKDSAGSYNISGTVKFGDKTTMEINSIKFSYFTLKPHVSFIIKKKDSVPGAPGKYEDVLLMSQSELQEVGKDIVERINDKFGLTSILGSLW